MTDWKGAPGCRDRCGGPWSRVNGSKLLPAYSAVCYLTGRNVYQALDAKVPSWKMMIFH